MQRLAMRRNKNLRSGPADHLAQFVAARMPRHMHQMVPIGNDLYSLLDQPVDDAVDRLLIAGDGASGKNHAIAGRECNLGMLILGDARKRRAGLALAAGAKRDDFVGWQIAVSL